MRERLGFTLIEVMIALVILSIAFSAIIYTLNQSSRDLRYLTDKTAAMWVADNVLNEARLGMQPATSGRQHQFDHDWYWAKNAEPTQNPKIERVTITVSVKEQGQPVAKLEGYVKHE
jgi:general secretion pathway protein I